MRAVKFVEFIATKKKMKFNEMTLVEKSQQPPSIKKRSFD